MAEQIIPREIGAAITALTAAEKVADYAKTYQEIVRLNRWANAMKQYWLNVEAVRQHAELVLIAGGWRAGYMARKDGRPLIGGTVSRSLKERLPTLEEMFGSKKRGSVLRRLAGLERELVRKYVRELHAAGKEATIGAVLSAAADDLRIHRRTASRSALPIPLNFRLGDCREVLTDITDNSVPLILTDPPYEAEAEPLYRWLAEFAGRVLIPGGSLICFTGHWSLNRDMRIFDEHLRYWWLLAMMHRQARRLPGKFVIANFKPVLWYVKEFRRNRTLVPDVLRDKQRDKDAHDWGQGEAGVGQLIENLTEPGELIVDPFAGTCEWGRIAEMMGRQWIGSDIEKGGSESVEAAE